eukprot:maker-scaffold100_size373717-snap-gene-2.50 protein:Tk05140 transcript:maker-scaffold100_size373717-snap-gene-2.50-mRNA-1 annotation:"GF12025"
MGCDCCPDLRVTVQGLGLIHILKDLILHGWLIYICATDEFAEIVWTIVVGFSLCLSLVCNVLLWRGAVTQRRAFVLQWVILEFPILVLFTLPFFMGVHLNPFMFAMFVSVLFSLIAWIFVLRFLLKLRNQHARAKAWLISVARFSPPRPSKLGVALAEQSTKNSSRPAEGRPTEGVSNSALTPTKMSELASLKCADPLVCVTRSVSTRMGRISFRLRPSTRRSSWTPWRT